MIYLRNQVYLEAFKPGELMCRSLVRKLETKWCYVPGCTINAHKNYGKRLEEELYIKDLKGRGDTDFCSPFVPGSLLSDEQLETFLREDKSTTEWRTIFQTILNACSKIETVKGVEDKTSILAKRMSELKKPVDQLWGLSSNPFKAEKSEWIRVSLSIRMRK